MTREERETVSSTVSLLMSYPKKFLSQKAFQLGIEVSDSKIEMAEKIAEVRFQEARVLRNLKPCPQTGVNCDSLKDTCSNYCWLKN